MNSTIGVFTGCTIDKYAPEVKDAIVSILNAVKVKYHMIENTCCGIPLIYSGLMDDAKKQAEEIAKELTKYDVIVVECPSCLRAFLEFYPKFGIKTPPVKHFSQFLLEFLKTKKLSVRTANNVIVTFHDPCELGRHCGIFEEPREVLKSIGVEIKELSLNREMSTCCGGGGLIRMSLPLLADEIAIEKIRKEILPLGVKIVVTACPTCFLHLKNACNTLKVDIEVYDLPLFISQFLG